jgi:hypothetical protein
MPLELIPGKLRACLDSGNLRAVELLEKTVANSKHFEHIGRGRIITHRGAAYVILDVPQTMVRWIHWGDTHLAIRVGWTGQKIFEESVCVRMNDDKPLADACVSFVQLVDCGWPRHAVPSTITVVVDEINRRETLLRQWELKIIAEEMKRKRATRASLLDAIGSKNVAILRSTIEDARKDGLPPTELAPAREALAAAAEAHGELNYGWLFEFVRELVKRADDRRLAEKVLRDIHKRVIDDAVEGEVLTTGFLLLAANSVTRLVKCGLDAKDIEKGFRPLFDMFSPWAIAAMSQLWMVPGVGGGGVAEAEVLDRYRYRNVCKGNR